MTVPVRPERETLEAERQAVHTALYRLGYRFLADPRVVAEEGFEALARLAALAAAPDAACSRCGEPMRGETSTLNGRPTHIRCPRDYPMLRAAPDARLAEALEDLLENLGGHDHWREGGAGGKCPTCVRQSKAASRARAALAAAREGTRSGGDTG